MRPSGRTAFLFFPLITPSTKPAFPVSARPISAFHPPNRPFPCLLAEIPPSSYQICPTLVCAAHLRTVSFYLLDLSRSNAIPPLSIAHSPVKVLPSKSDLSHSCWSFPCLAASFTPSIHQTASSCVCLPVLRPPGTEPSIPVSAQRTIDYQRLAQTRLVHSHQTSLRKCLILNAPPDQSRPHCPE